MYLAQLTDKREAVQLYQQGITLMTNAMEVRSSFLVVPEDYLGQCLRFRWERDELIKGCPEVQSLAVHVEGRAVEQLVVVRLFLVA